MKKTIGVGLLGMGAQLPAIVLNSLNKPESLMSMTSWCLGCAIGVYTLLNVRARKRAHERRDREQSELFKADFAARLADLEVKKAEEEAWKRWGLTRDAATNMPIPSPPPALPIVMTVLPPNV